MNLKTHLLTRMLTLGLLCWVSISAFVTVRTTQEVKQALIADGARLQEMVEYGMYRRQSAPEGEGAPQLVGSQYGLLLGPYCLSYEGWNGQLRQEGCGKQSNNPMAVQAIQALGLGGLPATSQVGLWGQPFGELTIRPDPAVVLSRFWGTLGDLLLLTTLILGSLAVLCYIVIGRAFKPAAELVLQLDSIAVSSEHMPPVTLPDLQPREFGLIAKGVNRLNDRLWQLYRARRDLLLKLLRVQEDERRELAHLVHADLGQSLSLIAVHCAQLRRQFQGKDAHAAEQLEQIDLLIENAFDRMRAVLVNKCPPVLDGAHLGMAIQDLISRWRLSADQPWSVELALEPAALAALDKDRALCVYRTIEECLANAQRHGDCSAPVAIGLVLQTGQLVLTVSNTVAAEARKSQGSGMGLQLLAERVRVHGGHWAIRHAGCAFEVQATFNMEKHGE